MTYIELMNKFWKQDEIDPMSPLDTKFYMFLINECNKRRWINPFELQSRIIELKLMITRKTIGEVRNRLKQRGLIDFVSAKNCATVYALCDIEVDDGNSLLNCFPQVTIEKLSRLQLGNNSGYNSETHIKTIDNIDNKILDDNNKILLTRTREEADLDRFDSFLRQIADGREQIWADQMRKKHGIENISDYLPSFRDHVIANSKLHEVSDINGFKRYFNVAFKYFSKATPIELLNSYAKLAKSDKFVKYCEWIVKNAPNVAKELIPLSEEELSKLLEVYGSDLVFKTILDLNNRRDLIPKYYSLFRTLKNWLGKEDRSS